MATPKKSKAQADVREKGLTGLETTAGLVDDEFLPELKGKAGIKVFRQMKDNDPTIGSILFSIDQNVRQVEWTVEPNQHPDAAGRAEDDAKFLRECMEDLSHTWPDFIAEVMTMIPYGWSIFEIVYKLRKGEAGATRSNFDDGKVGWRKFAIRSQESLDRWEFDESDGSVKAFVQKPAPDYKDIRIPIEKLLLFRTTTVKNNPEGRSVLRNAYRSWYYKQRIEQHEAVGIERDLAGLPIAYVDAAILREDATDEEKQVLAAIKDIVGNIKRDKEEGVIWPTIYDGNNNLLYKLELLSSGGSRSFDTTAIIDRYDKRMAMSVLADFVMLGTGTNGSFALASSKTNMFGQALGAWLRMAEGVMNTYAVPRLFEVNGMPTSHLPQIKAGDVETPELAELGAYLSQVAALGMPLFPNKKLEEHLLNAAKLPLPTPDEHEEQEAGAEEGAAMGPEEVPTEEPEGGGWGQALAQLAN